MNTFSLQGKVCMITGGLGSFATAISGLMLKRGAKMFLCDVHPVDDGSRMVGEKFPSHLSNVHYYNCDVTNEPDLEEAFKSCRMTFGSFPDVVILMAGVSGEENWNRLYDVNLKGVHRGIELAFKFMGKDNGGKGGVVVVVSSTAGITCKMGSSCVLPAYFAGQHAVVALTRCFGQNFWYQKTGVRITAVAPCSLETPSLRDGSATFPDGIDVFQKSIEDNPIISPDEAALKLINILNSYNGSVWMLKRDQLQPFNVPDYVLPKTK